MNASYLLERSQSLSGKEMLLELLENMQETNEADNSNKSPKRKKNKKSPSKPKGDTTSSTPPRRGRSQSCGTSPGENHSRRRSLSLGRRRSRSQSRSNDRSRDEYGHCAPTLTPTNDTTAADDDEEDEDGFGDGDGVQVFDELQLGLPANLPPNDILEEDYDPAKHWLGDDFTLTCGTCYSDNAPVSLSQLMEDLFEEAKELCSGGGLRVTRCRPLSHVHCGETDSTVATVESIDDKNSTIRNDGDDDSNRLATNDNPLKMEETRPLEESQMHRGRSRSRSASRSPRRTPALFSPYGDDDSQGVQERSKSMERKVAKWKLARSKMKGQMKNKEPEQIPDVAATVSPTSVTASVIDGTDWRAVRDDVLSQYEQGHFVAYEAGRVQSSTKRCSSRAGQEGEETMERFLYM